MSYSRSIVDDLEWNQDSGQYEPAEYVLTVNPTPADATVNFDTGTVSGNTCSVLYNTTVHYTISKTGYITSETYTKTVTQDETVNAPALTIETHTLTINPTPADAVVTITAAGYTQVGNSITVPYGTTVSYSVSKTGYNSNNDTITLTTDQTINVSLVQIIYTLTINPTPVDATVTLTAAGYSQVGNSITVPINTNVQYTVEKTGYISYSNDINLTSTQTINVTIPEAVTLTIDPTPADATVYLVSGDYEQVGNSITVAKNSNVMYLVLKLGYAMQANDITVTQDQTLEIELEEGYLVKAIKNTTFQNKTHITSVDLMSTPWVNDSMYQAFIGCTSLTTVTNFSSRITNTSEAFKNCTALTGDIVIPSDLITNATDMFYNTTATKNVYIPFNGTTYSTFISAGYDEYGTKEGVYLKDINQF